MKLALFNDATEIVWKVADRLHEQGLIEAPPHRQFVHDADEAHRYCLEGVVPIVGMSLDDVVDCVLSGHPAAANVTAFSGVHRGFLSLMGAAPTSEIADLRGKTIAVDTYSGYASALFEVLKRGGLDYRHDVAVMLAGATDLRFRKLVDGEFSATLLGAPFDILAEEKGFKRLARILDVLGAYQGIVFAAQRSWLDDHPDEARTFLSVFRTALAWAMDQNNRPALQVLLSKALSMAEGDKNLDLVADRLFGADTDFEPKGVIAAADVDQVLKLFAMYRPSDLAGLDKARLIDGRFGAIPLGTEGVS